MAIAYPEYEKLFLLEVLVDSVRVPLSNLDLDPDTKKSLRETCVMFQFLDYPPLVVCEEVHETARQSVDDRLNFKSGKSCIFSIRSSAVPTLPYSFDVSVSVLRKVDGPPYKAVLGRATVSLDDSFAAEVLNFDVSVSVLRKVHGPPYKAVLGRATVSLGDSFTALMHSSVAEPDLPLQKTRAGTFDVEDDRGRVVGQLTAFLRISCFGQLIVTQFQVGGDQDALMFKGTEPKRVVELPGDPTKSPKFEVDPTYQPRAVEEPAPVAVMESARDMGYGYGDPRGEQRALTNVPYNREALVPVAPPEPEGNFKEIVAEIRGHSLHIRVPMRSKKDKEGGKECKKRLVEEMEGPVCKFTPPLNFCDCDFPVPPEAIPRCGQF